MGAAMQCATRLGNLTFAGNSGKHVPNLQLCQARGDWEVQAFAIPRWDGAELYVLEASGRDDDLEHTRSDLDSGWRRKP